MNRHIQNYLNSFKLKKDYGYTLLIDTVFLGIIVSVFLFFGKVLEKKAWVISQGKTTEQLQQMLLSMDPQLAQAFLGNLKGFVITFAVGLIIVVLGGLLLYSLSRKLIWNCLLKKEFNKKTYWKWNSINLVLIIPVASYLFAFGLVRLMLGYGVSLFKNQAVLNMFYDLINLFFLFSLIIFIFLVYYSFAKDYKVWEGIGKAFYLVKTKGGSIGAMFLFILATVIVWSVITWPLGKLLQQNFLLVVNAVSSLLFLAWIRIYVFKTVRE